MSDVKFPEPGVIELFGVRYDLEVFRTLGLGPPGTYMQIVSRDDNTVTLRKPPYLLDLTGDEGRALVQVLQLAGGCPERSGRRHTEAVLNRLEVHAELKEPIGELLCDMMWWVAPPKQKKGKA